MRIQLEYKPADAWSGSFVQQKGEYLHMWICILPFFPLHLIMKDTNVFTHTLCCIANKKETVLISIGEE